jgi:hypothetical protein
MWLIGPKHALQASSELPRAEDVSIQCNRAL